MERRSSWYPSCSSVSEVSEVERTDTSVSSPWSSISACTESQVAAVDRVKNEEGNLIFTLTEDCGARYECYMSAPTYL